nr:unnamed protein product [Spirometra erinaceieuropaei]
MAEEDDAVEETGETRMIYARLDERDRGRAWVVLAASFLVQLLMDGTVSSYGVLLTNMRNDTKFKESGYTEAEFNIPGAIQPCLYIFMNSIGTEASFGARPRLSSLFRRKLSVQAERSLVNESLFRLTPRPSLAPRQANPATNPGHMHDFRESSLHLGNGTYIGRPMALSPLNRADSFYSASLASLRYQDRRLREAAARSSMLTETDMDVSFKSCLSFDLSASLQMSRRTTNASNQNRRQQLLQENSIAAAAADELAQSMLTIEGKAEPQKVAPPMFASRCRRLASFLDAHFDLSLLRSVDFWLVTSILITSQLAYFMPFVYLVEYAKECGISPREGVLLIMIIGKPSLKQAPKNVALSAC